MKDCKKEKTKTIYSNPLPMEKKIIGDEEAVDFLCVNVSQIMNGID